MERTFEALTATEDAPVVDSSVTPDVASPLDLNAIAARLNDISARLDKIEAAEKSEPWHNGNSADSAAPGYTDAEIDGEDKPAENKEESEEK